MAVYRSVQMTAGDGEAYAGRSGAYAGVYKDPVSLVWAGSSRAFAGNADAYAAWFYPRTFVSSVPDSLEIAEPVNRYAMIAGGYRAFAGNAEAYAGAFVLHAFVEFDRTSTENSNLSTNEEPGVVRMVAGGATAAARARRLEEKAEIVLFERGEYVSFANCGLPYYVGEVIKKRDDLLVTTASALKARYNIDVRVFTEVTAVDPNEKVVHVRNLRTGLNS